VCPGKRVEVINNGVDEKFFSPQGVQIDLTNLVFEGSISFGPNKDGVLYFVKDILPKIRRKVPEVTLTIVGRNPPPEILSLACPSITVTGFVEDVRPYLERAAVFVCPLREGAGIKNKVLQAWSMGKAVVATTPSVGGLKVRNGENIIVSDDPSSFAEEVTKLLKDPAAAASIGKNAQNTINEHYTWEKKSKQLENLLFSIVTEAHR
jgi:glycosyltransferase involved in cell wall biosynthesis